MARWQRHGIDLLFVAGINMITFLFFQYISPFLTSFSTGSINFRILAFFLIFLGLGAVAVLISSFRRISNSLPLLAGIFGPVFPISYNYIMGRSLLKLSEQFENLGNIGEGLGGSEFGTGGLNMMGGIINVNIDFKTLVITFIVSIIAFNIPLALYYLQKDSFDPKYFVFYLMGLLIVYSGIFFLLPPLVL